jgi:hypothetical protein
VGQGVGRIHLAGTASHLEFMLLPIDDETDGSGLIGLSPDRFPCFPCHGFCTSDFTLDYIGKGKGK